jgi:hypothetical protein
MKRLFLTLVIVLLASPAFAVTLAWDNAAGWVDQGVVGIRVYFDDSAGGVTRYADVPRPNNLATIDNANFTRGVEYNFWATAYNTSQESGPSNVVTATYNWDGTWGVDNGGAPTPNTPTLRLSPTAGGFSIPTSSIKTAP